VVLGLSLQVGRWVVLAGPGRDPYLANVEKLNHWAGLCVIALVVCSCVQWVLELRRLLRPRDQGHPDDTQGVDRRNRAPSVVL
jgi:hypothetical protein